MNERVYPAGTGTYSKGASQFPANAPRFAISGSGAHVVCSDGIEYIDWTAALGAIVLGYADPDVDAAVAGAMARGNIFGLPHRMEFDLAERLAALMPWPETSIKFGKHGSDVTTAAVRAGRFLTGRKLVDSHGYHGFHDWACPNEAGTTPQCVRRWDGTRLPTAADLFETGALIIEPEAFVVEDLNWMRRVCTEAGTLLIFDEVLSGFRTPGYTLAKHSGVTPDFICLGKAISNGVPLSAIAGPYELMRPFAGDIGYSFTYGGELTGIAAALATLDKFEREPVIARLWEIGQRIRGGWELACAAYGLDMPIVGQPSRLVVKYPSLAHRTLVSQEMIKRGILWSVGATPCWAHSDSDVDKTLVAIQETLEIVGGAKDPAALVEGPLVSMPYRAMVVAA